MLFTQLGTLEDIAGVGGDGADVVGAGVDEVAEFEVVPEFEE